MSLLQLKRSLAASSGKGRRAVSGHASWRRLRDFAEDTAGDVAMIFGLMALVLFVLIGAAVDLGRWLNARDHTVSAVDASVLAAARALQTNGGNKSEALATAKAYYTQAVQSRLAVKSDDVRFEVGDNGTSVKTLGNAKIATPFMGLIGIHELPLLKQSGIEHSKAVMAVGGNANLNLEIALMLDVSGSMSSNNKIGDMKDAAKDLVNIVVWDDQSAYKSRVAIVPFSTSVRPPDATMLAAVTDPASPPCYYVKNSITSAVSCNDPSIKSTKKSNDPQYGYRYDMTECVGDRQGSTPHTDDLPGGGSWIKHMYAWAENCGIDTKAKVMPLSSDKAALLARINELVAGGNTAGHVGTMWAQYMLSPKWSTILPSASQPADYGAAKTQKIAVLMTDGEYNAGFTNQGLAQNVSYSSGQAIATCNQMKNNGITVYTVGFDLGKNATATNTLKNCASDSSKAYTADTGEELKAAFRDIALKVSSLYLANTGR
mgnify:CR=1 FL=1